MIFMFLANGDRLNRANPSIENYAHQSPVDIAANTPSLLRIFALAAAPNEASAQNLRMLFTQRDTESARGMHKSAPQCTYKQ